MSRSDAPTWNDLQIEPKSALLIIDVQNGFVNDPTRHVPNAIRALLDERGPEFSVRIATKFINAEGSNFRRLIEWRRLAQSPETDLAPEIVDQVDEVIEKNTYSAIGRITELLGEEIRTVYVCGIDTDVCVLQNAAGLFDAGLTPFVLYDACATNGGAEAHAATFELLGRTIGRKQVISLS